MSIGNFFQSSGSTSFAIRSVSANATITPNDFTVIGDATSGAITFTLPLATSNSGQIFVLKKLVTDVSFNAITCTDGTFSTTLNTFGETLTLQSNGTTYITLDRYIPDTPVVFTPTGAWSSNTTYTGIWFRQGVYAFINVKIVTAGAPTSATLTINQPANMPVIDTTKLAQATGIGALPHSSCTILDSGTRQFNAAMIYVSTSAVQPITPSDAGLATANNVSQAAPMTWANGDNLICSWAVPITGWNG